ncbi:DUF4251 domain-containing protein [Flavobacterium sp. JAS]|uniref:DUF4251 domain-containing protein n=1 Tax=Flavobacterium sp. JAS TaxID=2897329 RepID=UPI001E39F844|nr:DUF4251 domain-containing protein [Flavobacterium sp. JAS]MCD0471506.1 DUF4251 domain-containing protein [Flavobacterium sp. JAS]
MKTKIMVLMLFCFFNMAVFGQEKTKKELKAERELKKQKETDSLINSKNFVFEAQRAQPLGTRQINLDYNTYFLKFNTTKTTCDLPFFGRAYNVAYGGDGGIKFEGVPENIQIEKKKKSYNVKATVKGKDDVYDLLFSVFYDGGATLSVNSNNRTSISYQGVIEAPKTEASPK